MKAFRFVRPRSLEGAASALEGQDGAARLKAGGIDLLDRLKERVDGPDTVVGLVDAAGMDQVRVEENGAITLGARVTLATLAAAPAVAKFLPTLAEAAGLAASPQIRNQATLGGNLAQHTRCGYYRHRSFPCLKRGGDHCPVLKDGGVQDTAGIFGNGTCASAHPSSLAPVLGSLDAEVFLRRHASQRHLPFAELWAPPAAGRASDTVLAPDEVIGFVRVPARDEPQRVGYAEIRQKAAFDWALVSCAVRYEERDGKVADAWVWFGSVAPTPWRAEAAEAALVGHAYSDERAAQAAEAAVAGATPLPGSRYKVQLARVALRRALAAARRRT